MEELFGNEDQLLSIIFIAILLLVLMSLAIVLFFFYSRKKIVTTELEKAGMEIAHQKAVIESTLIIQEEERKRIAQDMHDAISSKLNLVSLNANFLAEAGISSEDANKFGSSILKVTTTVLESSRRIAHNLLPPTLQKFGLQSALEELCDEAGVSKKFEIHSALDYQDNSLSADEELHLFRIVQELFSNSIKYSSASVIDVSLVSEGDNITLIYKDNGIGFDLSEARKAKGLGLSGLENRASILNAALTIDSSPGNGISVIVSINKN